MKTPCSTAVELVYPCLERLATPQPIGFRSGPIRYRPADQNLNSAKRQTYNGSELAPGALKIDVDDAGVPLVQKGNTARWDYLSRLPGSPLREPCVGKKSFLRMS